MKVIGITCSPRKGNTDILVQEALAGAKEEGAKVEFLAVREKNIKPCDECLSCKKSGKCHIKDDMQDIYPKLLDSDGIIFGSPVFYWSMSALAKILIERTYAFLYPHLQLANKVGGAIAVAGRRGCMNTLHVFHQYFAYNHMISADLICALADEKGKVVKDEHGMKSAFEMGRQVALLTKLKFKFPEEFNVCIPRFVERKYKTLTYPKP